MNLNASFSALDNLEESLKGVKKVPQKIPQGSYFEFFLKKICPLGLGGSTQKVLLKFCLKGDNVTHLRNFCYCGIYVIHHCDSSCTFQGFFGPAQFANVTDSVSAMWQVEHKIFANVTEGVFGDVTVPTQDLSPMWHLCPNSPLCLFANVTALFFGDVTPSLYYYSVKTHCYWTARTKRGLLKLLAKFDSF